MSVLLTPWLVETIQRGEVVLFLGAGASFGALGPKGEKAPSGDELRDILCDRFLGGALKSKPLSQVAELAKNEAGLPKVQEAIKELFDPLQPASFHYLVPTFRWFSIVTTNYDLVLERAYAKSTSREQTLAPVLRDGDNFSDRLRDSSQVLYLKLHGCISQIADEKLPLILASEEYAKHRSNRERLFRHFQDWGRERPIIFCGYDIADPNIQQILFDLADMGIRRPLYGLVRPGIDQFSERYWASKRFAVTPITFEKFLKALDSSIPKASRGLAALVKSDSSSIAPWVKTHVGPSVALRAYLQNELTHVQKGMPTAGVSPRAFYKGLESDWGVFQQDLDVRRRISDELILESFLDDKKTKADQAYVLRGHAGSGKTIALRRTAWDAAHLFGKLVFHLKEGGVLRRDHFAELHSLVGERIFVVLDDVIPHVKDASDLLAWSERTKIPVTLIFGARTNEWNVFANDLADRVQEDFELRDLTEREISQLIGKLDANQALGRLANASAVERVEHFRLSAERQLLVALHDISGDKPFEEIVLDEYRNIQPAEARILYLDVCTLHRLGVGVRAGLISRVSGVTFEWFREQFFKPLEHVVRTYYDHASRDNMYRSRHALIAEIVFKHVLPDAAERANQIIRIIKSMDVDYASDKSAFNQIVRGRVLADLFANKRMAFEIFDAAVESGASKSFVEHQRAVFELNHPERNLARAMEAIERAEAEADYVDKAILHTKATILRGLAQDSSQRLVREKYRENAMEILLRQTRGSRVSHPFHLAGQLLLDKLKDKLSEVAPEGAKELQERSIAELMRQIEEMIYEGLQRFPDDQFLLTLESEFARVLQDKQRASIALARAFEANPGRSFIAVRLAAYEREKGNMPRAIEVLKKSIGANPGGKEAHLALAKIHIAQDEKGLASEIDYHLKRSFTPGDSNFDAQFWYARHNYLFGDRKIATECFKQLANAWTPSEYRNQVKGVVMDKDGSRRRFSGSLKSVHESYCFVNCPDMRAEIFAHSAEFKEQEWGQVGSGDAVSFEMGFALRGPTALKVRAIAG